MRSKVGIRRVLRVRVRSGYVRGQIGGGFVVLGLDVVQPVCRNAGRPLVNERNLFVRH
jgi:hypothetical protein